METEKRLIYLEDAIVRIVDTPSEVATMAFEGYYGFMQNPANILVDRQNETIELLEAVSPVDAVEVVRGRWDNLEGDPMWQKCSACGFVVQYSYSKDCNYCPNCGAKMDGGTDNVQT